LAARDSTPRQDLTLVVWEERRKIIHATDIILDSDKKVVDASYSIGPIGRIVVADALSHSQFVKRREAQ
jgi:hypothetical protein